MNTTKTVTIGISAGEFAKRRAGLLKHINGLGLTGVVLFDSFHILYFTSFAFIPTERPVAFVMNSDGLPALFVPRLEVEHARVKTGFDRVESYEEYPSTDHPMKILSGVLSDMGVHDRIGADQDGYPQILGYRGPTLTEASGGTVFKVADFVEDVLAVKSPSEIELIRESCIWANLAHRLLQQYTKPGASETEVSRRAGTEATLAMLAALGPLYQAQSPFSSGPGAGYRGQIGRNAAIPHAMANNIVFRTGDVLVSGASAPMWGYNSELERTMIIGQPTQQQRDMFEHMKALQEVAFDSMVPGQRCSDVDRSVRDYYEGHGLMQYWRHHTGHAIGLRYHEGPFLDIGDYTELKPGMVFTVEPGLYSPELGGFRHSDTVRVTETGAELLTFYPGDLDSLIIDP
jgi:Xaa-Pro dipeptidase